MVDGGRWQTKEHGELGLMDIRLMVLVANIKRMIRIWTSDHSLWVDWMKEKFMLSLNHAAHATSKSPTWATIVRTGVQSTIPTTPTFGRGRARR